MMAEIDLHEIVRGECDLDVVGLYARPDILQSHANAGEQRLAKLEDIEVPQQSVHHNPAPPPRRE